MKPLVTVLAFGALTVAPALAEVSKEKTSNSNTNFKHYSDSQRNIVKTVTSGGALAVIKLRRGDGADVCRRLGRTPSKGVIGQLPNNALKGDKVKLKFRMGKKGRTSDYVATSNGDNTFDVPTGNCGTLTINTNGKIISVNDLGGSDSSQSAMNEQFSFDRGNGFKSSQTGASAGGAEGKLALWVNGGYSTFDEDHTTIAADGNTWALAVGGDWLFNERFIAGLAVTASVSDTNSTFNSGDLETNGYTVSPYFVTVLGKNKNLLLDGAFGYTISSNDATRATNTITSSFDSSSWFVSSNLTYILNRGDLRVTPKVGVLWIKNTTDAYTESGGVAVAGSSSTLGRANLGARIDYTRNLKFTPFLSITGEYDFETEDYSSFTAANRPDADDTGAVLGAGFSSKLSDRASGNVSATTALMRKNYKGYTLSGTLRFNF
jgi:outer membrane autotransporter protein